MQSVTQGAGGAIKDYISLKMVDANIENIKADTQVKLNNADKTALEGEGISIDNARSYQDYQMETQTYGNRLRRDQIETAITGLELVKLGLTNENLQKENAIKTIELAFKEFEKIINAAQSIQDLKGTQLGNAITAEELAYMKKHTIKMGTENPMVAIFKKYLINEENADTAETAIDKALGGVRGAIVKRGAKKHFNKTKKDKYYHMKDQYEHSKYNWRNMYNQ